MQHLRHSRPDYVPVHGHYVNPPGTRELPGWVLVAVGLAVLLSAAAGAFFIVMGAESGPAPHTVVVTPATYGPPPATTGAGR